MLKCTIRTEDFLSRIPLFQPSDTGQLARLAGGTTELEAPRGTILYRRGDTCSGLYALVYGQAKLSLGTNRGGEMVVELAEGGSTFGEAPLFSSQTHILTATSLVDSKLLHIAKETLFAELERDAQFARRMIAALSERLYRRYGEFENYVLASGTERVIRYLLRGGNGTAHPSAASITLPASKGVIASRLHLTHEHFSRILRELTLQGLIEVQGRQVRILSKERLSEYAVA